MFEVDAMNIIDHKMSVKAHRWAHRGNLNPLEGQPDLIR